MCKAWKHAVRAICVACAALYACGAAAQAPLDASVKAAYIYRFLEYVAWPAQAFRAPDDPIVIGVTHVDEVTAELQRIVSARAVQKRPLTVVQMQDERELPVHVLYAASLDSSRVARALKAARQRPILIVTDAPDGLEKGATINFVQSDGRIKFEVSLEAAAHAGLNISSRLLAVALRVKKGEYGRRVYASLRIPGAIR